MDEYSFTSFFDRGGIRRLYVQGEIDPYLLVKTISTNEAGMLVRTAEDGPCFIPWHSIGKVSMPTGDEVTIFKEKLEAFVTSAT